jgi:hypothetical protein
MEIVLLEEKVNTTSREMLEKICEQYSPPKPSGDLGEFLLGMWMATVGTVWTGIAIGINHNTHYDGSVGANIGKFVFIQIAASPFWICGLGVGLGGIGQAAENLADYVKISWPRTKNGNFYYLERKLTDKTNAFERSKDKLVHPIDEPEQVLIHKGQYVFLSPAEFTDVRFAERQGGYDKDRHSADGKLVFKGADFKFTGKCSESYLDSLKRNNGAPGYALCFVLPDESLELQRYTYDKHWKPRHHWKENDD